MNGCASQHAPERHSGICRALPQRGVSLIEMLVAVLLLSFGMLAMAGLHASSLRLGKMAQFRSVAQQLGDDYADRMRAALTAVPQGNRAVQAGPYIFNAGYDGNGAIPVAPACPAGGCTVAQLAAWDLWRWRTVARNSLPGGSLFVQQEVAGTGVFDIWVLWMDPQAPGANETAGERCPGVPANANPAPRCLLVRAALW